MNMLKRFAIISASSMVLMSWSSLGFAQSKDVLMVAQRLNKVENPSEIDRWWTSVINTQEGKTIADMVATYFGYPGGGTTAIEGIAAIVGPGRNAGNEHWGTIKAPVDYTVMYRLCARPIG
jgi:hypothetical protein